MLPVESDLDPRPFVLASATVPYRPLSGAPAALDASEDGQYVIVTSDELHLLVRHTTPTTATATPAKPTKNSQFRRTLIKVDKKRVVRWSDWLDDIEVSTPGQNEPAWRTAAFSPAGNVSTRALGGAALATATTNGQVLVFEPTKDAQVGEWIETFDLTSKLVDDLVNPNLPKVVEQTPAIRRNFAHLINRAQTTTIAWSGPLSSNDDVDGSILAVGHRSGEVSLWRYAAEQSGCLHRFRPKSNEVNWINALKWSRWTTSGGNQGHKADLAIGDSDGRVWTQTVTQRARLVYGGDPDAETISMGTDSFDVEVDESNQTDIVATRDRRNVTQFCWIDQSATRPVLAYTKLGTVNVVKLSTDGRIEHDQGYELEMAPPRDDSNGGDGTWMGSTNWATCCGIIYSATTNSLAIHLSSGLVYSLALAGAAAADVKSPSSAPLLPSVQHTRDARHLYERLVSNKSGDAGNEIEHGAEQPEISPQDGRKVRVSRKQGSRILGVVPVLQGGGRRSDAIGFIFVTERPDFLEYHVPSTVRTHFAIVGTRGLKTEYAPVLEQILQALTDDETNALHSPPHHSMSLVLESVSHFASSSPFVTALVDLVSSEPSATVESEPNESEQPHNPTIHASVCDALFARGIERLRKKFTIVERLAASREVPTALVQSVERFKVSIERELVRTVVTRLAHVLSKTQDLSESEKPVLTRLLLASSALPSIPLPRTNREGSEVSSTHDDDDDKERDPSLLATAFESTSQCPACRTAVPFANVRTATCSNGHTWERCSITLELVSRVDVRTCSGLASCRRKALIQVAGEGFERVNRVLDRVKCCAYCGGRWIRVR